MSYWSWSPSLSIGIDEIDNQHRRIVDYLNDLDVAHHSGDRDKVSQVLLGLMDYTKTHFNFEESLLEKSGYPLTDSHKKVHETFVLHMNDYHTKHNNGEDITRQLMSELRIWLTNHIKKDDADYAPYANKILNKDKNWSARLRDRLFG